MRLIAALHDGLKDVSVVVAFVQAHVLENDFVLWWKYLLIVERLLNQKLVVHIGGGDGQSNRYPVAVGHQAPLGSSLGSIR